MKKELLLKINLVVYCIYGICFTGECSCDTSIFAGETTVVCVKVNCPIDSVVTTYRNGKIVSIRNFSGCGMEKTFVSFHANGDTLTHSRLIGKATVGLRRIFYASHRPERFTTFDSLGRRNGWEVFWYANGNVKDSVLFRNDSTIQRTSFYHNGSISTKEKDIYGNDGYDATSYTPGGSKTGVIQNGTGTILVCDSVGGDCRKLTFKDKERVFDGKGGK